MMRRRMLAIPVLLALALAGCGAGGDDGGGVATAGGTKPRHGERHAGQ